MTELFRDKATVNAQGEPTTLLPHGVTFRNLVTHSDDRGIVFEMLDDRWGWHPAPITFVYHYSIRPGCAKGWGMHLLHEDRYCLLYGEMEIVFYDARPESPTVGQVSKVVISEYHRRLISIPTGIWHANRNIGTKDCLVVNFPTVPYDHNNPDKYRLPLYTDEIPYKFPPGINGW